MSTAEVSMKLLIDNGAKRVLFVDFLFYILSLPIATVIGLLKEEEMGGSWPNLYQSLQDLSSTYIQPGINKEIILKPAAPPATSPVTLLALEGEKIQNKFYRCVNGNCGNGFTDDPNAVCSCGGGMNVMMAYVAPPAVKAASEGGGVVKEIVTYMVMDDLVIKPMSTISSIALLNKFHVKDVGALEERVVTLGMKEALKLLKASHCSKNVLTDVFC